MQSRNQREGKYAGWNFGHHVRYLPTNHLRRHVSARRVNIIQTVRLIMKELERDTHREYVANFPNPITEAHEEVHITIDT